MVNIMNNYLLSDETSITEEDLKELQEILERKE